MNININIGRKGAETIFNFINNLGLNIKIQSSDDKLDENVLKAVDISNNPKWLGKKVTNYKCQNSDAVKSWEVFYADSTNIYLISGNYISSKYVPKGQLGSNVKISNCDGQFCFGDVGNDYKNLDEVDDEIFEKWLPFSKNFSYRRKEIRNLIYMLDVKAWKNFCGKKAKYAIGAPTLEMFVKSYNKKYPLDKLEIIYEKKNILVKWLTSNICFFPMLGLENDPQYVLPIKENNMWIATTGELGTLLAISGFGGIDCMHYKESAGFRPIVCLNSDTMLKLQEDGNFIII